MDIIEFAIDRVDYKHVSKMRAHTHKRQKRGDQCILWFNDAVCHRGAMEKGRHFSVFPLKSYS